MGQNLNHPKVYRNQVDAVLSQVNPVSNTVYLVLSATDVIIWSIYVAITWAVTQPTPITVQGTMDGITYTFSQANPVSTTWYFPNPSIGVAPDAPMGFTSDADTHLRNFSGSQFLQGHIITINIKVTWATTQPTPFACRVKYRKLM